MRRGKRGGIGLSFGIAIMQVGLSPQARGKLYCDLITHLLIRSIPASAGETLKLPLFFYSKDFKIFASASKKILCIGTPIFTLCNFNFIWWASESLIIIFLLLIYVSFLFNLFYHWPSKVYPRKRGSERISIGWLFFRFFLSCLRGSEPVKNVHAVFRSFLSCLRGSERIARLLYSNIIFLSCLRGSELPGDNAATIALFLSCLRGSERNRSRCWSYPIFLSCLRGSEHKQKELTNLNRFLSCLRGSEQSGTIFIP